MRSTEMSLFKKLGCGTVLPIIAILLGYFAFLTIFGFLFVVIERGNDEKIKNDRRKDFLKKLDKYNISYNSTMIKEIVTAAMNAFDVNGLDTNDFTNQVSSEWHIGSSMFFAGTIVTTIGYGNITPKTTWGKVLCIILAVLGIPFTGVVLGKIGVAFTNLIKKADTFIENRIKQCYPKSCADERMKGHVRKIQLAFVFSIFIVFFLLIPAAIFLEFETDWRYFDSFYYCFISLSTIGLGDLTPGGSLKTINLKEKVSMSTVANGLRQITVMLYLLFGLAALSITLTIIGSILQSAAKRTLQSGTSLMTKGGRALKDVSGLELVGETKRFASSFRKKTAIAFGNSHANDASAAGKINEEIAASTEEEEGNTINNNFAKEEMKEEVDDKQSESNITIAITNANIYSVIENEESVAKSYDEIHKGSLHEEHSYESEEKDFKVVTFSNKTDGKKLPVADACDA